jgi:Uma2 family endonuclease
MRTVQRARSVARIGPQEVKMREPAWQIATLFPVQGQWTEDEYLALDTNHLIELSNGCLEVLPAPTIFHQLIVQYLFELLKAFVTRNASGHVLFAPLPVRLWPGKLREPDVLYLRPERARDRHRPPESADLVMEVVSGSADDRKRDLETKRAEYAKAQIAEYWIVDPQEKRITVLSLEGAVYRLHGEFREGEKATSAYFPEFSVDVRAVFAAGEGPRKGRKRPGNRTARRRGRKRL